MFRSNVLYTYIDNRLVVVVVVVVQFYLNPVLCPNNGGGQIYPILIEIVLLKGYWHHLRSTQPFCSVLQLLLARFSLVYST